jgi:hypothetical protein
MLSRHSGTFHSSCVAQLDARTRLNARGVNTKGQPLRTCLQDRFRQDGTRLRLSAMAMLPDGHDWVASAWQRLDGARSLSATWKVPSAPTTDGGQTLYLFPGLEPLGGTVVVQPVLTWTQGTWSISSWACCVNGIVNHSTVLPVQTGDTILGEITGSNCNQAAGSCAAWTITTTDLATGLPTMFVADTDDGDPITAPLPWVVGGALEAWNLTTCDQYPADGQWTFGPIRATTGAGGALGAWTPVTPPETPSCAFRLTSTPSTVSIARSRALGAGVATASERPCRCGGHWPACTMCPAAAN